MKYHDPDELPHVFGIVASLSNKFHQKKSVDFVLAMEVNPLNGLKPIMAENHVLQPSLACLHVFHAQNFKFEYRNPQFFFGNSIS